MESPTRINADGFGVGWYNPAIHPEPAVFKDITPAWNNANLGSLAGKVASGCILAHVRAATRYDPVHRANCHPFQHHRLLFMHNGDIPGRGELHRRVIQGVDRTLIARIQGNTDTELAFTLFLSLLEPPLDRVFAPDELADALARTVERIVGWHAEDEDERPLVLNFCATDGSSIVVNRHARRIDEVPSLHWGTDAERSCVVLASERLSTRYHWRTVEPGSVVIVRPDLEVEARPVC